MFPHLSKRHRTRIHPDYIQTERYARKVPILQRGNARVLATSNPAMVPKPVPMATCGTEEKRRTHFEITSIICQRSTQRSFRAMLIY